MTNGKSCLVVLLLGASLSVLNACSFGQAKDIDPNQPVKPNPETGIIVGSVTAPMVQHYWDISHFRYRKTGESKSGVLESASPTTDFLWIKGLAIHPGGTGPEPGLEHQLGRVFAVELMGGTVLPS